MSVVHFDSLSAGLIPVQLTGYITLGDWAAFHTEASAAKSDATMKACLIECGACWFFGLWCAFCFHTCIEDGMGRSKMAGCCHRANMRCFQGRSILTFNDNRTLTINTGSLASLPRLQQQVVGAHSPMQQYAQQPQMMMQPQPQMMMQPQPQMMVQPQPQMMMQPQPQMMQTQPQMMQQPQMVVQPQPQMMAKPQPQMMVQQPAPMVQAVLVPDNQSNLPPPPAPVQQRVGEYIVNDPAVVGTVVTVKTQDGSVVGVSVPAGCPVGTKISYGY